MLRSHRIVVSGCGTRYKSGYSDCAIKCLMVFWFIEAPPETNTHTQGFTMSRHNMVYIFQSKICSLILPRHRVRCVHDLKKSTSVLRCRTSKNEGQMIWSAQAKLPEPNSVQEVRHIMSSLLCLN